jgi:hypothetical protein
MAAANLKMAAKDNPEIRDALLLYGDAMSNYTTFQSIPEELRGEAALVAWIYAKGHLQFIPKAYRSEFIFEAAVIAENDALYFLGPEETSQYEELALIALKKNPHQIQKLAEEFFTEAFTIKACTQVIALIRYIDWSSTKVHLATPNLIRTVGSVSLIHAGELVATIGGKARALLDEEVLRVAIKDSVANLLRLDALNARPILEKMLKEGFWYPETDSSIKLMLSNGRDYRKPPASPEEALFRLLESSGEPFRILHRIMMKTFPIESVILTLSHDAHSLNFLFDLYSADELRPHTQLSRAMRGRLLEQEMGL